MLALRLRYKVSSLRLRRSNPVIPTKLSIKSSNASSEIFVFIYLCVLAWDKYINTKNSFANEPLYLTL